MKVTNLCVIGLTCFGFAMNAQANNVILTSDKPMELAYHVARANGNGQPVFSELRTMKLNQSASIACELKGYERSGVVIVSVNGHVLPDNINQFNQPKQCSMTTDNKNSDGTLKLTLTQHSIQCATSGGVFS